MSEVTGDVGEAALVKRRRLASELRVLRDVSGFTGRELARTTGLSQSKVVRIESGATLPTIAEVKAWTRACRAEEKTQELLKTLTEAARMGVETWQASLQGHSKLPKTVVERQADARRIRSLRPFYVASLLRTSAYAGRVFEMKKNEGSPLDVNDSLAELMNRLPILFEKDKEFEFLLTERAVQWNPASVRDHLAQLDRIARLSSMDNISIGIVPLQTPRHTGDQGHGRYLRASLQGRRKNYRLRDGRARARCADRRRPR